MTIRYEPAIDLSRISAIDTHVHVEVDDAGRHSLPSDLLGASAEFFGVEDRSPSLDEIAESYREWGMAAVVFTVDAGTALGYDAISSEEIATGAARNNDVLLPFGSVDPLRGDAAVSLARRLVEDHGVRGFKFHASLQRFDPSDVVYAPLWEAITELDVPVIFHTGRNGIGAGLRGGRGIKLASSNPMLIDSVAADHPELTIVLAHPSDPWQDEANAIALHKANVYIDLSGWSPRYFPESLVRLAGHQLQDRVLFATDYPLISPHRWLTAFDDLLFDPAVRLKILKTNAQRLLGLGKE